MHESDTVVSREAAKRYENDYGDLYSDAIARVRAAVNKPIASLFELPKGEKSKVKTEILFIERCLALLKPGGRLGIVLPEGIFNNPSLAYVREFCENRAFIRAVVSLPQETFVSSGASVKASLLFIQKFTAKEQADFDAKQTRARAEVERKHADAIAKETKRLEAAVEVAKEAGDADQRKTLQHGASFEIPAQVFQEIDNSRLVIADLTDEKQNVYCEVGYAKAKGIPFVLTFQKRAADPNKGPTTPASNKVHFDLAP